jgi:hypothetical protein
MVRTFIITMAGGMATWRPYVTLPEEKVVGRTIDDFVHK